MLFAPVSRQAGFLNRSTVVKEHPENGNKLAVKRNQEVTVTAWGRSQDVLRERDVNAQGPFGSVRTDLGKPTARFDVGDICEVIGAVLVREGEDLGSAKVTQLLDGCRVQVTNIGSGPSGKRIAVQDTGGVHGWVSVVSSGGEPLVRIIEKERAMICKGSGTSGDPVLEIRSIL
eukprot:g11714.t1